MLSIVGLNSERIIIAGSGETSIIQIKKLLALQMGKPCEGKAAVRIQYETP